METGTLYPIKARFDRPIGYKLKKIFEHPINYGELPGLINPADGDPWDVIVPGIYEPLEEADITQIIGFVPDSGGNHKLIGKVEGIEPDKKQVDEFVKRRKKFQEVRKSPFYTYPPVYL